MQAGLNHCSAVVAWWRLVEAGGGCFTVWFGFHCQQEEKEGEEEEEGSELHPPSHRGDGDESKLKAA